MPEVLPDLGLVAAAGFLLLIAAALWVLERLIVGTFGRAPVIGGWVTRDIGGWLNDARNGVLHAARSSWDGAVRLFDWASGYLYRMWQGTINTFLEVANTVVFTLDAVIPRVTAEALTFARSALSEARVYTDALTAGLERTVERDITAARSYATALVSAAVRLAERDITAVRDYVTALVGAAETAAANALARASTLLAARITAAEQTAAREVADLAASTQAAVDVLGRDIATGVATAETVAAVNLAAVRSGIYTDLETWGDQAVARAWPDAAGDLAGLRRAIGGDFPWLNDLLGGLAGLGTAGLAGALIRSLAGTHAITRLAEDCIVPNCRNLSGLGNALHQLLALGFDAALIGWVTYAIADPVPAAADTFTVADPISRDTLGTLEQLLGVSSP